MKMTRRIMTCLLLALPLAGCATLVPKIEAPELRVVRIEMLKGDLLKQTLRVTLHARNANGIDLSVQGIQCDVEVAGERFAHGESEKTFVVPARGEADFDIVVTANAAAAVLRILGGGAKGGQVDYRMSGKVELKSVLIRNLPFEQKGRVDLRQGIFTPTD